MGDVDLIVIGAGMAGMNAAARASEAGASVVVIERDRVGGTCPIRGCIPSKALIRSAEIAHEVRSAGVRDRGRRLLGGHGCGDDRVQAIIDTGASGARTWLESALRGLEVVMGEGRFEEPGVVAVDGARFRAPASWSPPAPPVRARSRVSRRRRTSRAPTPWPCVSSRTCW